jgi:hypothetical protein
MIKKYGGALYNDVMYQFHGDKDSNGVKEYGVMLKDQNDNNTKLKEAQDKKDLDLSFQGDYTKVGDAFLSGLKDPREQQLVKAAGDGRMKATNLAALMRGKNGKEFGQAIAQYDPSFKADKVDAYYDAVKQYENDSAGAVGGKLKAAGTAAQGLRKLYDDTNNWSLLSGTKENVSRQNDIGTIPNEVAKFNAAGRQPGEKDVADLKASLDPRIAGVADPRNRREAVKNQVELMTKSITEMEDTWKDKAPSDKYESLMPNLSPTARVDIAYVLNDGSFINKSGDGIGKYITPRGAQAGVDPKTGHQIFTFDGKQFFDASNGLPITIGAK